MEDQKTCPRCNSLIPRDAPGGACPVCVLDLSEDPGLERFSTGAGTDATGRHFGGYKLGRQIGCGGMGVVYEARQESLNRQVAIKLIRDSESATLEQIRRFKIEAEAAARLNHPNIVPIHEVGDCDGHPFFSMDLVQGESLRERIRAGDFALSKEKTLGPSSKPLRQQQRIARLMATTARAVQHAHDRGVLHRDLKPANILVDAEGRPHLTDFGLAKIVQDNPGMHQGDSVTKTEDILGSLPYMAPEQVSNQRSNFVSDVYGLGAILYDLLTGRAPFRGSSPLETLQMVQHQPPTPPRAVQPLIDKDLETVCLKCLEKDPRRRYASPAHLAEDLENWLEHKPIKARRTGPFRRALQWIRRNPVGAALIASLSIGLAITGFLLERIKDREQTTQLAYVANRELWTEAIRELWASPDSPPARIPSKSLALMDKRKPTLVPTPDLELSLGATMDAEPTSMAEQYARLLGFFEKELKRILNLEVALDLVLYKGQSNAVHGIISGEVDFLTMRALDYLHLLEAAPDLQLIVREDRTGERPRMDEGVFFTQESSSIRTLEDLAGRTMALGDDSWSIRTVAMATLVNTGMFATSLSGYTNILDTLDYTSMPAWFRHSKGLPPVVYSHRESIFAVLRGEYDVGVSRQEYFEKNRHRGLREIGRFRGLPDVWVAAPGLDRETVAAFRKVMLSLKEKDKNLLLRISDETATAFDVPEESFLQRLRDTVEKASLFDTSNTSSQLSPTR